MSWNWLERSWTGKSEQEETAKPKTPWWSLQSTSDLVYDMAAELINEFYSLVKELKKKEREKERKRKSYILFWYKNRLVMRYLD